MTSETIAQIRNEAAASLSPEQQQWEQFLTPMPVAEQAVSLFTPTDRPVRILDLGSGSGILSAVVAGQSAAGSSVVASEQDADLAAASESSLRQVCDDVTVINDSVFNVMLDDQYGGGKHAWAGGRDTQSRAARPVCRPVGQGGVGFLLPQPQGHATVSCSARVGDRGMVRRHLRPYDASQWFAIHGSILCIILAGGGLSIREETL